MRADLIATIVVTLASLWPPLNIMALAAFGAACVLAEGILRAVLG